MQRTFAKAANWQKNVIDYHMFGNACNQADYKLQSGKFSLLSEASLKLHSSCTQAALEHRMFLLLKIGKKSGVEGVQFFRFLEFDNF